MPSIQASTNDNTNLFLLNGLDRSRGMYTIYYDSVEKNSSDVIDETIIRVGLKSRYEGVMNIEGPHLVADWTDGTTPYSTLDSLVAAMSLLIA